MKEERTFVTKVLSTGRKVKFELGEKDGALACIATGDGFELKDAPEYKEALKEATRLLQIVKAKMRVQETQK